MRKLIEALGFLYEPIKLLDICLFYFFTCFEYPLSGLWKNRGAFDYKQQTNVLLWLYIILFFFPIEVKVRTTVVALLGNAPTTFCGSDGSQLS